MKIAQATTVHKRDDSRIFRKECRTLAQAFDVTLIVADGFGNAQADNVRIIDVGRDAGRLQRFLKAPMRVASVVFREKIDVVHFHDPELIPLGLFLRLTGRKVVYDVHEDLPRDIMIKEYIPRALRATISRLVAGLEWLGGRAFSGIVAATPTIADRFPAKKTAVILNYPMPEEFGRKQETTPYAERPRTFAYVGTLSEARGVIETVAAMAQVPQAQLLLAGAFNTQALAEQAAATPGWERVDYRGFVSRAEVERLLDASRAGLVTLLPTQTHLDSYPIKLFEYMAAGLPVIVSDFPLWRRILEGIDCAMWVDSRKLEEIAGAMTWILENPTRAEAMGVAGRDAVLNKLNWTTEGRRLVEFYRDRLGVR